MWTFRFSATAFSSLQQDQSATNNVLFALHLQHCQGSPELGSVTMTTGKL